MRGMAVEDDLNAMHGRQQALSSMPISRQVSNAQLRAASLPQQRGIYNTYPTTEYGFYPPGRDTFVDYPYAGFSGPDPNIYRSNGVPMASGLYPGLPQTLHPNAVDLRQQHPPVYFDYNAATRPPSQFFFPPPQAMIYPPHSPMLSSQLPASSSPVTLTEKKHEIKIYSSS
ncbi:hypothetical protein GGX14DRAFT_591484 [Mycena pura]|uniref:Uncharacterized protein n=1 Tax=Mycena pura TaxID=153505 RepID=A0AAD6VR07_9AGAR|nr:hypothetical protein GGX14DRAFT_591484 [Mycena pura]